MVGEKRPVVMGRGKFGGNTMAVLDTLTESGFYSWLAPAENPFGAVEGALFAVDVACPNYGGKPVVVQTMTQAYTWGGISNGTTFLRTYYDGAGWSDFVRLYSSSNPDTLPEAMKVEYIKNINPDTTGCASLLEYMAKRYEDHSVIFGSISGFSDMPSGATTGQAEINLCGGVLTVTIRTLTDVWYRATNSLTSWYGTWKKATMT